MTSLFRSMVRAEPDRIISINEAVEMMTYNGSMYELGLSTSLPVDNQEVIAPQFRSAVETAYKRDGAVFACILVRLLLFSEASFQFKRPGEDLFGNNDLLPLENPWPNATTRNLLARMEQDVSLAGNWFGCLRPGPGHHYVKRMRPDWTYIISGTTADPVDALEGDIDSEVIGYAYVPGGYYSGNEPQIFTVEEVAHYAPIPDPTAFWRGMSWLQPVVAEVMADKAATAHKLKFFEHGATPNLVVVADVRAKSEQVEKIAKAVKEKNEGLENAYKTLVLGGGADAKVVGADLRQIDFKATQGAGETRIAAAAGVPPIIAGFSEGLTAATYSNYNQALRRFADGTLRPLWGFAAGALGTIIPAPGGSVLWYDDRDIPFLQDDVATAAQILTENAATVRALVDGGFTPESVVAAVLNRDLGRLKHTGMYSVQLHPPGTMVANPNPAPPPQNQNQNGNKAPARTRSRQADQLLALVTAARQED